MKIAVVQFMPEFCEKAKNINKIQNLINNTDADLLVFPELALSGYSFDDKDTLAAMAEPFRAEVMDNFQELSIKQNKIIVLGFAESDKGKFYNSAAILFPEPNLSAVYRKTHLFYKEKFVFEDGNTGFFNIYYEKMDLNLGTMICYDWRFPEAARSLALSGADLIVCPANLVTNVWRPAMAVRALENKVYLAVANRIGSEAIGNEPLFFNGDSAIYNYNGEFMSKADANNEAVIYAEIEPSKTRNKFFNQHNSIFADRRPEMYKLG